MKDDSVGEEQQEHPVRAMRRALGITGAQVEARGGPDSATLSRVENGHNACSSWPLRERLAKGLGLTVPQVAALLDGSASVEALLAERGREVAS